MQLLTCESGKAISVRVMSILIWHIHQPSVCVCVYSRIVLTLLELVDIDVYVSFSFLGMPSKFRVSVNDTDKLNTTGECDLIINEDSITLTNSSTGMNKI